ncbi:hypothetical protein [Anaplasma capra]|uniref:hypothetical protein n=1 Tax=Anaplasma capra TaxID=1562740 RepID=UPI0021D5ABC6|nr:hypothetical protein [Anaplasma capra]MCU7611884.1 hypothetical protein [Anaplasma capra]MCU7612259.1 hypothetical protein [Anaplasma capra]
MNENDQYDTVESVIGDYVHYKILTAYVAMALLNMLLMNAVCCLLFLNKINISGNASVILLQPFVLLIALAALQVAGMLLMRPRLLFFPQKPREIFQIYAVGTRNKATLR